MEFSIKPVQGSWEYDATLEQAVLAEECGFDGVSLSEHHGLPTHWASPLLGLAGIATRTSSIGLSTSVKLLPLQNPVELASRIGLLDSISGGRTTMGFGLGWRNQEFEAYGVPKSERGARMDEYLEILDVLFEPGPTTYEGQFYQFENFEVSPRPVQSPRPAFLVGGWSERAFERAAEYGDGWTAAGGLVDEIAEKAAEYRTYDDGSVVGSNHATVVRESADRARADTEEFLRIFKKPLIEAGHVNSMTDMDDLNRRFEEDFDGYVDERFIVSGTPDDCIEKIQYIDDRMAPDEFIFRVSAPGWSNEKALETIRMLGNEVLPSF